MTSHSAWSTRSGVTIRKGPRWQILYIENGKIYINIQQSHLDVYSCIHFCVYHYNDVCLRYYYTSLFTLLTYLYFCNRKHLFRFKSDFTPDVGSFQWRIRDFPKRGGGAPDQLRQPLPADKLETWKFKKLTP